MVAHGGLEGEKEMVVPLLLEGSPEALEGDLDEVFLVEPPFDEKDVLVEVGQLDEADFLDRAPGLFVEAGEADVIAAGVRYLHIEGAFYYGIGVLFLLYGLYRALGRPGMSVVLTVISLGTRVALAYILSAGPLGVAGIWWAVPIGWALADAAGVGYYLLRKKQLLDAQ